MRKAITLRARLRDRSAKFDIDLLDLSVTGFRAEADYTLHAGDIVWINLPGLAGIEATIAWREGRVIGAAFRQPLYPAVFDHLTAMGR
ncbi:MAG: PilZ domain-containing protein [Pseudomonadota bacterium]|nr:PilZ domain-containing protein [Pseudomonadota bacterium]